MELGEYTILAMESSFLPCLFGRAQWQNCFKQANEWILGELGGRFQKTNLQDKVKYIAS